MAAVAAHPTLTLSPSPPADCAAAPALIAKVGFDPYAILAKRRPDVLAFYQKQGWNPATQCVAIYNNWTAHGAGGKTPTTPAVYVRAQGWAPVTPQPTPTPYPSCQAPAQEVKQLGFDPYLILQAHRSDVLQYYAANGWNPATQCVAIYNNWTAHGAGGKTPTTPAAYVQAQGWAPKPVSTPTPPPQATPSPTAVASVASTTASVTTVVSSSSSSAWTGTYTVQPGDTLTSIAARYHVTVQEMQQHNHITNPDRILVGEVLHVPVVR
jgi:LysM repeat protein